MAVNIVTYGGRTLVDMTNATATAETILKGYTAYGKSGDKLIGTATTLRHSASSITLRAADWNSNKQTVSAANVTADAWIVVQADVGSEEEYTDCGVMCTAQADGALTFACDQPPEHDLTVDINVFT